MQSAPSEQEGPSSEPEREAAKSGPSPASHPPPTALSPSVVTPVEGVKPLVERARRAQKAWGETHVRERVAQLAQVKRRLLSRAEEIANLLHEECGKPIEEAALSEV